MAHSADRFRSMRSFSRELVGKIVRRIETSIAIYPYLLVSLRLIGFGCLVLASVILIAAIRTPVVERTLSPSDIQAERDFAFTAAVASPASLFYVVHGSGVGIQRSGSMVLLEDGIPLGPENTQHDLIRQSGSGAHSHWGNSLYFSSSDGTDIRRNGRVYSYRVGSRLRSSIAYLGAFLALIGAFLLFVATGSLAATAKRNREEGKTELARVRGLGWLLLVVASASVFALTAAPWLHGSSRVDVDHTQVSHRGGHAYNVALPDVARWPLRIASNLSSPVLASSPTLLENGLPIGRLAASVGETARAGGGRYISFVGALAFSTPDGSDPRYNGKKYVYEAPVSVSPAVWQVAIGVFSLGLAMVLRGRGSRMVSAALRFERAETAGGAASPKRSLLSLYVALTGGAVATTGLLFLKWWGGTSGHLGLGGYLPVSDALGYFRCALSIAALDTIEPPGFDGAWCARRVLYPAMLSTLLGLTGWRPSAVLVLQALIIGLSAGVLALALQRVFGLVTAVLATIGVLVVANEYALGNFMTEAFGLPAGLIGLALLVLSVQGKQLIGYLAIAGLALISFGMAVRAGALVVLPILGLWTVVATHNVIWDRRWRLLVVAAAALALGPALQYVLLYAFGIDPSNTGGNFSTTLYGLSTGSRDWSQAYRDFAELFQNRSESAAFEQIQGLAIENIRARPEVFVQSLLAVGAFFRQTLFSFLQPFPIDAIATQFFWLGVLVCVIHFRRPRYTLLLAFCIGEFLSAPLVFDSGGHRVLVVSLASRLTVAALPLAWLLGVLARAVTPPPAQDEPARARPVAQSLEFVAVASGALLLLLAVLSAMPLAHAFRLTPVDSSDACKDGEWEVVARLGRESMQMAFAEPQLPLSGEVLGIPPGRLELDPNSRNAWWLSELRPQPRSTTLIYAVQRASRDFGMLVPVFNAKPVLDVDSNGVVTLCLLKAASQDVKVGDFNFYQVVRTVRH